MGPLHKSWYNTGSLTRRHISRATRTPLRNVNTIPPIAMPDDQPSTTGGSRSGKLDVDHLHMRATVTIMMTAARRRGGMNE